MAQVASKYCDICQENPRREYCWDCDQYFCERCKTLHLRSKISKDHNFQKERNVEGISKVFCTDHTLDFIFVCNHCDVPVCKACITERHNGHNLTDIKNAISSMKTKLKNEIQTKTDQHKEFYKKLQNDIEMLDKEAKSAILAANKDKIEMTNMINTHVESIVASIKNSNDSSVEKLKTLSSQVRETLDHMDMIQNKYDSLEDIGHNSTLIIQLNQLSMKSKEKDTLRLAADVLTVEYTRDKEKLFGAIQTRKKCIHGPRYNAPPPPPQPTRQAGSGQYEYPPPPLSMQMSSGQYGYRPPPPPPLSMQTSNGWYVPPAPPLPSMQTSSGRYVPPAPPLPSMQTSSGRDRAY